MGMRLSHKSYGYIYICVGQFYFDYKSFYHVVLMFHFVIYIIELTLNGYNCHICINSFMFPYLNVHNFFKDVISYKNNNIKWHTGTT